MILFIYKIALRNTPLRLRICHTLDWFPKNYSAKIQQLPLILTYLNTDVLLVNNNVDSPAQTVSRSVRDRRKGLPTDPTTQSYKTTNSHWHTSF